MVAVMYTFNLVREDVGIVALLFFLNLYEEERICFADWIVQVKLSWY